MSLDGDDWSKHNLYSSMVRLSDSTPSRYGFTIHKVSTPVSIDGPSLEVIASSTCCGTNVGEDADIWLWAVASGSSDAGLQACVL